MDSTPVSAFSVYKAMDVIKPKQNQNKKKKKRKGQSGAPTKKIGAANENPKANLSNLSDNAVKQCADKIKKKNKNKKQPKVVGKLKNDKPVKVNGKTKEKAPKKLKNPKHEKKLANIVKDFNGSFGEESLEADISISSNSIDDNYPVTTNSVEEALKIFKWMIAPYDCDRFLKQIWEKKPLHVTRNKPSYYKELISTPMIDELLRTQNIQYDIDIDITAYENGKRETLNSAGRAHAHEVWNQYLSGCSVRLLHPERVFPNLHLVHATLQEFFNSYVGANSYLTPPDSQGFAPHYDDIEAFALQIEGKKFWRVYKPRNDNEVLARVSSGNFDQDEIGKPIMEVLLEAGDMLYFPRGYIHQAVTVEGEHSLHVTVSMYQKHAWADLLEILVPTALEKAIKNSVDLRRGLPFNIYNNFGLVHPNATTKNRKEIEELIKNHIDKIKDHLDIDEAVDQFSKEYYRIALPPVLTELEKEVTVQGDTNVMIENGVVVNRIEIDPDTKIRLVRKNILRVAREEDKIFVYHYAGNTMHQISEDEQAWSQIEEECIPTIESLIRSYPKYVSIEDLDGSDEIKKMETVDFLWNKGLIMTESPLEPIDSD